MKVDVDPFNIILTKNIFHQCRPVLLNVKCNINRYMDVLFCKDAMITMIALVIVYLPG